MHGYGIASWIEQVTDDVLRVEEGSLYPALHRMARKGWIRGEWGNHREQAASQVLRSYG
jgi:PadR family transcriptional regulator, regulatory protein PadR